MNLVKKYIPAGCKCDTGSHFIDNAPNIITIHWVGPFPGQTPDIVRDYWINSNGEASAHFIIKDDDVLQCWPIDKIAWHAGCRAGNITSIGIEVIPKNIEGEFSEKSIKTLKELLKTLPKIPLVRHYDWTGKKCPAYYCDNDKWQELIEKLR